MKKMTMVRMQRIDMGGLGRLEIQARFVAGGVLNPKRDVTVISRTRIVDARGVKSAWSKWGDAGIDLTAEGGG